MNHRIVLTFGSFFTAAVVSLSAQTSTPALQAQSVPDTGVEYRLFVGLDVEVGQDEEYALIEGYVNNRVHTDGSDKLVSLRNVDDLRFTHKAKLSRIPLTIKNLHAEQISANVHAARDALRNQQSLNAYRDQMVAGMISDMAGAMGPEIGGDGTPVAPQGDGPNQEALDAQTALSDFE